MSFEHRTLCLPDAKTLRLHEAGQRALPREADPGVTANSLRKMAGLFADAEAAEDATQKVVGVEFPSDVSEMPLCGTKFLGDELPCAMLDKLGEGRLGMHACAAQRLEVTQPCRRCAGARAVVAHAGLEVIA